MPVRAIVIYMICALFLLFEMTVQSSPSVMANNLLTSLSINAFGLSLIAAFYFLSYASMQIPVGLLLDRYPLRWLLSAAILLCAMGSFLFGSGHSLLMLSFARFMMGLGSSFAFISVLVVATEWFEAKYFPLLVGIAQCIAAIGGMAGEYPLSLVVNLTGWRYSMVCLAIIGLMLAGLSLLFVKNATQKSFIQRFDIDSISSALKTILTEHQSWWIFIYAFCVWTPIVVFIELWGVPFLVVKLTISNPLSSQILAFTWIGLMITSPLLGYFSERIKHRKRLMLLCALIGFVSALLILFGPRVAPPLYMVLFFLLGVSASGQILTFAMINDLFGKKSVIGTAIGFINMAVVLGGLLLQPIGGFLLTWRAHVMHHSDQYTLADYQFSLMIVPIVLFVATLICLFFLKESHPAHAR